MKTASQIREKWLNKVGLSVSKNNDIGKKINESALGSMEEYANEKLLDVLIQLNKKSHEIIVNGLRNDVIDFKAVTDVFKKHGVELDNPF